MNGWVLFLEYRISMAFLLAYLFAFLSLEYTLWQSLLRAAVSYLLTGGLEAILFFGGCPAELNTFLLITEIFVVQITAWLLSSYRDMRAVFTGITAATYVLPGNVLYMGLASFLWGEKSYFLLAVPTVVHLVILLVSVWLVRDRYLKEMEEKSRLWNELWIVPAFFYGITYMLTMWSDTFFQVWQNWVAILMILVLMDIIFIFMMRMLANLHEEEEIATGRELLMAYADGLKRQTEVMKKMEEDLHILRHDGKYRRQMIRSALEQGKTEVIWQILEKTEDEFYQATKKRFCNNVVLDGSIAVYERRAAKAKITFECKARMPEEDEMSHLNEFEFATVVMNLLDNAVRAAEQVRTEDERFVSLRIHPVKSQVLLEIANTFTGEYRISKVTGLPLSDRGSEHGFGMRSVQSYAKKYHAVFQYEVRDGMFYVRLLTEM